jgi:hypothetical protein
VCTFFTLLLFLKFILLFYSFLVSTRPYVHKQHREAVITNGIRHQVNVRCVLVCAIGVIDFSTHSPSALIMPEWTLFAAKKKVSFHALTKTCAMHCATFQSCLKFLAHTLESTAHISADVCGEEAIFMRNFITFLHISISHSFVSAAQQPNDARDKGNKKYPQYTCAASAVHDI